MGKFFSVETLKSKTFWGVLAIGICQILAGLGIEISPTIWTTVELWTGISIVDRSTKLITASK